MNDDLPGTESAAADGRGERVLVLGDGDPLGRALVSRLIELGMSAQLDQPDSDAEARSALEAAAWQSVVIVTRDDARALRLTLLCAHLRPQLRLWTTLFDRTIVHQLRAVAPGVTILSPAELAAAGLAEACTAEGARGRPRWRAGVRIVDGSLRLALWAGAGLLIALLVQIAISLLALHERLLDAAFFSVQALATIADSLRADRAGAAFKIVSTVDTVVAVGLLAVFTAALVRLASRPRLTAILGRRRAPARDHVIVVGCGQVGFRLAERLRAQRVPVVVVESNEDAPTLRLAHRARVPVALGRGDDRATLLLLGVRRCAVVAAVTSDDLTNVAVGLAAHDIAPGTPLVLRLGDGDVAAETDSLLHLGRICDIHDAVAADLAVEIAGARGRESPTS